MRKLIIIGNIYKPRQQIDSCADALTSSPAIRYQKRTQFPNSRRRPNVRLNRVSCDSRPRNAVLRRQQQPSGAVSACDVNSRRRRPTRDTSVKFGGCKSTARFAVAGRYLEDRGRGKSCCGLWGCPKVETRVQSSQAGSRQRVRREDEPTGWEGVR